MFKKASHAVRWFLICSIFIGGAAAAFAETVKATLSSETVTVGDSVELRVELPIFGGTVQASRISVDGLTVNGPELSASMQFGTGTRSSTTLIYTVEPERAGTFTIPALQFQIGNRNLQTEPVSFKAEGANQSAGKKSGGDLRMWAEIILPKKTAYVGEMLPAEIRLYVDSTIKWRLQALPTLDGEGFTKTKLSEPKSGEVQRDGRKYDVAILHTGITPIKAGTIQIGPSEFEYQVQIPRARPNHSRSPFDSFFGDDFFNDPNGPFARLEPRKSTAEPVELTVKPLPVQGRPASFTGSVGEFTFSSEGSPNRVKVGDPVTMKLKVSGIGNFDRVNAPVLADATGWRTYPPTSSFKADDDVSSRGAKTFEVAVIPESKKTQMPLFDFCYFDPAAEKYVTASSSRLPLTVEGEAPAPPPAVHASHGDENSSAAGGNPPPAPQPEVTDIHGINYDPGTVRSFEPEYLQRKFWMVQIAPLFVLSGLALGKLRKPKIDNGRAAMLRRERAAQFSRLHHETDRTAFYDSAARVLQLDGALLSGQAPDLIDAATVRKLRDADPAAGAVIDEVFQCRAEALYAGGGGGSGELRHPDRRRIIEAIERLGGVK